MRPHRDAAREPVLLALLHREGEERGDGGHAAPDEAEDGVGGSRPGGQRHVDADLLEHGQERQAVDHDEGLARPG